MNYNEILTLNGKTITVLYTKMYETVAKMVLRHYDTELFDNTLFVINVLIGIDSYNIEYRIQYPGYSKYIYYQLENIYLYPENVNSEHMYQFDEIWDCSIENIQLYGELEREKSWYMPLRYVDIPKVENKSEYKYDLCFVGTLTPFREDMISRLTKYWDEKYCRIKIISGYHYSEVYDEISECKYLLDIGRRVDAGYILDYVYILDVICSGKIPIINIRPDTDNPFDWLVYTYYNIDEMYDLVARPTQDFSGTFKDWTDNDDAYEYYRKYFSKQYEYKPRLIV